MTATAPPADELVRPCPLPKCGAKSGEPCRKADGSVFERVHTPRAADPQAPAYGLLKPVAWDHTERRRWTETQVRADERDQVALRLAAWASTLDDDNPLRDGVLAAAEIVREGR